MAVLAAVMITGCATKQDGGAEAFRLQTEQLTTMVLLGEEAPPETAVKLHDLSINVRDLMSLNLSEQEIKAEVLSYIANELEGRDQAIAMFIANSLMNEIARKLQADEILPTELKIYVLAAASGIESGADIYLLMIMDDDTGTN
jgi:hypothetical protein